MTITADDDDAPELDLPADALTPAEMLLAGADARSVRDCVETLDGGAEAGDRARVLPGPVALPSWPRTCASRSAR